MNKLVFGAIVSLMLVVGSASAFTVDKHTQSGVTCNVCHQTMPPKGAPDNSVCEGCHNPDALVQRTAKMKPNNPHENHLGITECNECHAMHKAPALPCDECHQFKFKRS